MHPGPHASSSTAEPDSLDLLVNVGTISFDENPTLPAILEPTQIAAVMVLVSEIESPSGTG